MKPIPNLVSIILPAHNAHTTLKHCLESIKAQTCRDYEVILIDDASTDESRSLALSVFTHDSRLHVISLPDARGLDAARSVGLDAARGQYIAFLDAEEAWDTTKLLKQREFMKQDNRGFTCTAYRTTKGLIRQIPQTITINDLVLENPIRLSTVMIDRHRVGDFRMPVSKDQDLITWSTLIHQGTPPVGLSDVLATCAHPQPSRHGFHTIKRRWHLATSVFHLKKSHALKLALFG